MTRCVAGAVAAIGLTANAMRAQDVAITPGIARATFDSAWSRVNATFYDTVFLATRWRELGDSLRPLAYEATTNARLRSVLTTLLNGTGVSHFGIIPAEISPALDSPESKNAGAGQGSIGASFRLAENRLVVWTVDTGGAAWRAGVRPGATLNRVNRVVSADLLAQLARIDKPQVARQARINVVRRVNGELDGPEGDTVHVELEGEHGPHGFAIARESVRGQMSRVGNLPPLHASLTTSERMVAGAQGSRRIGIIAFSVWLPVIAPDLFRAFGNFHEADALVIDLRGNPGGFAAMINGAAGHLLDSAYALGTLQQRGVTIRLRANPQNAFAGRVAVLVDPLSASASEFFAAGLQALGRARIFGDTTAGASVPAILNRLPNGDVMMHAIADHTDPKGRRIEGKGVIPDEVVPLRVSVLRSGRDEALEAALRWAAGQ